jgi:hypothetical protein
MATTPLMELSSDASNKAWDLSIAATFPSLPVPALPGIQAKAEVHYLDLFISKKE